MREALSLSLCVCVCVCGYCLAVPHEEDLELPELLNPCELVYRVVRHPKLLPTEASAVRKRVASSVAG